LPYLVEELDGGALVAFVEDLEHSDSGAVVDGSELVEALPGPRNALRGFSITWVATASRPIRPMRAGHRRRPIC
jgi:hypothetical protein